MPGKTGGWIDENSRIAFITRLIKPKPVSVADVTHKLIANFIRVFNYEV